MEDSLACRARWPRYLSCDFFLFQAHDICCWVSVLVEYLQCWRPSLSSSTLLSHVLHFYAVLKLFPVGTSPPSLRSKSHTLCANLLCFRTAVATLSLKFFIAICFFAAAQNFLLSAVKRRDPRNSHFGGKVPWHRRQWLLAAVWSLVMARSNGDNPIRFP